MVKGPTVGLFIRDYLLEHGPSSAYDLWKAWAEVRKHAGYKVPSYQNFYWNFIWRLKKMGLIKEVGRIKGKGRLSKVLLDIVPEKVDNPAWLSIQSAYAELRGYRTQKS